MHKASSIVAHHVLHSLKIIFILPSCAMHGVGLCLNSKFSLSYFVALYSAISLKHLDLCPNRFGSVNVVLYTSIMG
jgi:hypothetical protein